MTESVQQQPQETQKNTDKEFNFARLREQNERMNAELTAAREQLAQLQQTSRPAKYDDDEDSSDEPYVDNKRLNKKLAAFERNMDQKIDQKAEMKARSMFDEERRINYMRDKADFNNVMSEQIIQRFADSHPELANGILSMPEGFARQKLVYENIKALGIDMPVKKEPSVQERIDANKKSPYYQQSGMGSAPYAAQGDFTHSGQKNAYEQMQLLKNRLRG